MFCATEPILIGAIEAFRYMRLYGPGHDLTTAGSYRELRAAHRAELRRLKRLEDDGWDLTRPDGWGSPVLIDTLRPDEDIDEADLPRRSAPFE